MLATSTDGVGTKAAIAQAMDVHDTIGFDLVGMLVDDLVVVGAKRGSSPTTLRAATLTPTGLPLSSRASPQRVLKPAVPCWAARQLSIRVC
ncbi:phosphoribosylformylglycinamidine cyclo-ligase [Cutibacterium acnes JCM 18909]|nr:phosphoribosylformylglycinamidine cyclo-ligase [Cutibacterium acnes JCM 18909]